jgi:hypothetical protein
VPARPADNVERFVARSQDVRSPDEGRFGVSTVRGGPKDDASRSDNRPITWTYTLSEGRTWVKPVERWCGVPPQAVSASMRGRGLRPRAAPRSGRANGPENCGSTDSGRDRASRSRGRSSGGFAPGQSLDVVKGTTRWRASWVTVDPVAAWTSKRRVCAKHPPGPGRRGPFSPSSHRPVTPSRTSKPTKYPACTETMEITPSPIEMNPRSFPVVDAISVRAVAPMSASTGYRIPTRMPPTPAARAQSTIINRSDLLLRRHQRGDRTSFVCESIVLGPWWSASATSAASSNLGAAGVGTESYRCCPSLPPRTSAETETWPC